MKHRMIILLSIFFILISYQLAVPADIHKLTETGKIDSVKIVIGKNPDLVNSENKNGNTPLHIAAYNGHLDVVIYLLKSGAKLDCKNKKVFIE